MRLLGNRGKSAPDPGTVFRAWCDVCGAEMSVERNVQGATSWAEALAGRTHLHDRFTCPNNSQEWHYIVGVLMSNALEVKGPMRRRIIREAIKILREHR